MTTVKKQKQNEAESYLSLSDPRSGVKPWSERQKFHQVNASEYAPVPATTGPDSDTVTAALALLKRAGIANDPASLDHAVVFQDLPVSRAATTAGGSVARYNARYQLQTAMRALPEAEERRHRAQGWIAYKRLYASIATAAKALADLGGESVTVPAMLDSNAARYAV